MQLPFYTANLKVTSSQMCTEVFPFALHPIVLMVQIINELGLLDHVRGMFVNPVHETGTIYDHVSARMFGIISILIGTFYSFLKKDYCIVEYSLRKYCIRHHLVPIQFSKREAVLD